MSLRPEDIAKWPILDYVRRSSTKNEAAALIFEFIKVYEDINPALNLAVIFKSDIGLKRYRSWAKVAFSPNSPLVSVDDYA